MRLFSLAHGMHHCHSTRRTDKPRPISGRLSASCNASSTRHVPCDDAGKVAGNIMKAVRKKRNVIYTPFFWRFIMLIIIHVPEFIFKKMKV
jgi:hypothetical protein